ncbi:hypothetical protein [Aeromonas veronii]|uniref:hypothetical protein n=1 Tax=Aeromonas veronii TaxID=654 RepID=UPI002715023C|nr:hypothetical protein [Aeromonas veronii]WLD21209.1 hypothetical protein O1Q77_04055 [Aeromonas veronii]HDN9025501.1 hypothetical protein [Aeromonas veronii]
MEINVVASGGLSPLAQRQGSPAVQAQERAATSPSTGSDSLVRDLGAVLDELGLSPQGESSGGGTVSIRDSLEAFINTMMGSLQQQQQQQQEQQLALQQQQRQEQEQRKLAIADSSENPLKRDLERLLETLDQQGGQEKASEQGAEREAVNPLQSQLTKLLESSGAAESGVTLKEVLSGLSSKLPSEPAERKGYRVDTQV